ncbi:MAG: hypothetical protein JRD89_04045 [Deltaproteobacteria bacterium]|nr:hypothetical protein [Deltaproteobacteria bacterium]
MALISIGGVDMPAPSEYGVSLQDIDSENTRRTETGVLVRDRVRAGVYKIQVKWKVTKTQLKTITDAIAPAQFTTSTTPTRDMYSGNRDAQLIKYDSVDPDNSLWELSAALIEF